MLFRQLFDDQLAQYAYLVGCQQTGEALLIDPERDIDRYLEAVRGEGLRLTAVAETHIHADFLSGARELAETTGAKVYLSGEGGKDWTYRWGAGCDVEFLHDGDTFYVGNVRITAVHTPGHTPEHLSFLVTDEGGGQDVPMGIASGDFVFVGDTGRPDLLETATGQQGAMKEGARSLYASVQRFLNLDDYLQVWPGHGAGSACGKALGSVPETTVGYERRANPALEAAQQGEDAFTEYILTDQPEPPLYFTRMKHLNRDGVPPLGALPAPRALPAHELADRANEPAATVIDARPHREDFMRGHLSGAIYAPFGKSFPTIAGSYVDPESAIYLVVVEEHLEAAVRSLVRVGLDHVEGYLTPQGLAAYGTSGGALDSIPMIDMEALETERQIPGTHVVDVRSLTEYRAGHVPGALLAPHTRLAEHTSRLPHDKTLLVHCGSGLRASSAASLLKRRGFEVKHVNDRFSNWADAHPDIAEQGQPAAAGQAAS